MDCSRPGLSINSEGLCPSLFPRVCSRLTSIESVMPSKDLVLCHPLLLPASFLSRIGVSSNKSARHNKWQKYQSFTVSINPSNDYSGLNSFMIDWLVCSPRDSQESYPAPQFEGINSSVLSLFYCPDLTAVPDYWKTVTLTRQTFIGKVMSLFFNTLSRFIIVFLWRSKCLLISWLQPPSTVILKPRKIKSVFVFSTIFPSTCHEVMGPNLENSAVATGLEKVNFHSNPKEGQCQEMFKIPHNCTHLTC